MKEKRLNIRIEEKLIDELKNIALIETQKTGYKISVASIIRKAIKEFIERNK